MSINVNLCLRVTGLPGSDAATGVRAALRQLFAREGIDDDVVLTEEHGPAVVGRTPYTLIISGFHRWRGTFEDAARSAVGAVAPDAVVSVDWDYPDGE